MSVCACGSVSPLSRQIPNNHRALLNFLARDAAVRHSAYPYPPTWQAKVDLLFLFTFYFFLSVFPNGRSYLVFFGKHYRTLLMIRYFYYIFSWEIFLTKILGKNFIEVVLKIYPLQKIFKKLISISCIFTSFRRTYAPKLCVKVMFKVTI